MCAARSTSARGSTQCEKACSRAGVGRRGWRETDKRREAKTGKDTENNQVGLPREEPKTEKKSFTS